MVITVVLTSSGRGVTVAGAEKNWLMKNSIPQNQEPVGPN